MLNIIKKNLVLSYFSAILISVFATHFLLSTRHAHFESSVNYFENIFDSLLMTVIIFPTLYFFFLRPLTLEIKRRKKFNVEL